MGLEWSRVDLRTNLVHLEASHTKAGKRRSVPLNRDAREAILSRARYRAEHCPASAWVFCGPDGEAIGDPKKAFIGACNRAKIENFHFHDLRHTCAAWLVSVGVSIYEVRDLLGHSTVTMTE
ncbi:single-strand DNA-binding protein [Gammaproteobacteria bacterium]